MADDHATAEDVRAVGLLGGGVIGGGWAARFALNGIDVKLFDPDPAAAGKTEAMLANARRAWDSLTDAPLPREGAVTIVATPAEAATDVQFIQESAPEDEAVKRSLLKAASLAAPLDVVISSSTSGLLPSNLQKDMRYPERLVVGHPFNPVYLLPLVEVCSGTKTSTTARDRAVVIYRHVGMRPLVLGTEIDGFVADRLLEALWREALGLVADGVATVEQVDDAIRYGAGLRWASMGTMMTYRIAGGEGGIRHFLAQFGPALQWPWSKLTDVPELTDELLDRIAEQSDAQADGATLKELQQLRDDCVVAVLKGLRDVDYAAGKLLSEYEQTLIARATEKSP